jgi:glycolate oxidase FAD binding subunit
VTGSATDRDLTEALADAVRVAHAAGRPLRIVGGDTKRFYGRVLDAEPLGVGAHRGIVRHDPAELVVTARAGTTLAELEAVLARSGQCLPFEPPHFGAAATVGGAYAAGLAGPARVARGPLRDCVLGVRLLTGDGRVLRFGGEVMKNVAGYDVARLLAGSLGILGIVLEVSFKVLPRPPAERTLRFERDATQSVCQLAGAVQGGAPVTASFWHDGLLHVRLAAAPASLDRLQARLGGEPLAEAEAEAFWADVREQRHPSFACRDGVALWRQHVAAVAPLPAGTDPAVAALEWNGAQRWYRGDARPSPDCTCFRGAPGVDASGEPFPLLDAALLDLHRALKRVFDPAGILNPGRMYAGL